MPVCSKCGDPKDEDDFPWRDKKRGVRKKYCRECQGRYHNNWVAENLEASAEGRHARRRENRKVLKAWVREYKTGKRCEDCGEAHEHFVLDFDHRDPSEKEFDVSYMTNGSMSLAKLQREVAKCDLVCANCHRYRTFKKPKAERLTTLGSLVSPTPTVAPFRA